MKFTRIALLLAALSLTILASGEETNSPALTNWSVAVSSFKKAGALIGQEKYEEAKKELTSSTTNLAAPY
jgi:hypothetical protein